MSANKEESFVRIVKFTDEFDLATVMKTFSKNRNAQTKALILEFLQQIFAQVGILHIKPLLLIVTCIITYGEPHFGKIPIIMRSVKD